MSLSKLIEAVEAGTATGGDAMVVPRDMSDLIQSVLGDNDELWSAFVGAHDGSMDDAKRLHDALLPDHRWTLTPYWASVDWHFSSFWAECRIEVKDSNPARAWLLAILRALEGKEGGE